MNHKIKLAPPEASGWGAAHVTVWCREHRKLAYAENREWRFIEETDMPCIACMFHTPDRKGELNDEVSRERQG